MSRFINQRISFLFIISFITVLASCKSFDATKFESNTQSQIIEFINGNAGQVVSISIVNAEDIYQYHFGKLSNGDTPNNQTIYEIGSITKTYTGLVVAKAMLDGKVELDKDIRHYLKDNEYKNLELEDKYITLRHLITHTSGLPGDFATSREDIVQGKYFEKISKYSRENYFDDLKKVRLNSIPGEEYQYSNSGTNLVAYILESIYEKPFQLLVSEIITNKTAEASTKFRETNYEPGEIVQGTDADGKQMPLASAYWFADGGLTSSIESITRYIQYQLSSEPEVAISHKLLDESWTGHGKAFYWNTYKHDSNEQMLYQGGGSMGTSCWLTIYPKKNIGVFIVTNVVRGNTQEELEAISDKVIDYLMAYNAAIKSDS
ncbi:hypothetical protein PA25_15420 [Pseudoalteromonas sp. A25]|uniref:serine hydrolase domain-containing protein n=1 Tax=Pseudoalteromonas sp. A25 TaxID=116092 RepID=UPI0012606CE5|nr:serine hydrolase domain-containing protein [Pseudoalteromonas sp. A25]BBN81557.1 hypothetical protein PA25_15420 [Pseudoalteromonas sp. A25]